MPKKKLLNLSLAVALGLVAAASLTAQQTKPVTTERLLNPSPGDWLTYGRTYDEAHHSPLTEINESNVSRLGPVWAVEVGSEGKIETMPLVADGVLYGTSTWSMVYAIDVRSGQMKWRWDPGLVRGGTEGDGPRFCCGPVNRGVALYEGRVFAGLLDGRLVALDAESGAIEWSVQTTPPNSDYSITGAPRVVKGSVIIGQGGGEFGVRGFVAAYDPASGKEKWRFYIVPGDPALGFENDAMARAAKTWNGEWWRYGGGGTPWDGIAYDPAADLLYVGTGNGSPWNADIRSPGGGDNLYLSSILALRPDTGEYVWHYQTTPGDHWDYNAAQPMILADLTINGRVRQVIMQAPKNGFFYVLDRITGEFISAAPFVDVNWATHIDPQTGRPVETPHARYKSEPVVIQPSYVGAHHWPPMAFNPATGLVYFPGQETAAVFQREERFTFTPGQWNVGILLGGRGSAPQAPFPTTGNYRRGGFLVAWDPLAQRARWRHDIQPSGGMLSTAGNLVFGSEANGRFMALNAETGATLWETRLYPGVATPVTYELDGRQYVAVMSGSARGRVIAFALDGKSELPR